MERYILTGNYNFLGDCQVVGQHISGEQGNSTFRELSGEKHLGSPSSDKVEGKRGTKEV